MVSACFSVKFWWAFTESRDTPKIRAPKASNWSFEQEKPTACVVQPGVESLG